MTLYKSDIKAKRLVAVRFKSLYMERDVPLLLTINGCIFTNLKAS